MTNEVSCVTVLTLHFLRPR